MEGARIAGMADPVTPFADLLAHVGAELECANVGDNHGHCETIQHLTLLADGVPVNQPVNTRFFDVEGLAWANHGNGTGVATKCLQCGGANVGDFDAPCPSGELCLYILMPRIETRKQSVINVAGQYHQQVDIADIVIEITPYG